VEGALVGVDPGGRLVMALEALAQLCQSDQAGRDMEAQEGFKTMFTLIAIEETPIRARLAILFQRCADTMNRSDNQFVERVIMPQVMYSLSWAQNDDDKCRACGAIAVLAQTIDGADKKLLEEGVPWKLVKWLKAACADGVERLKRALCQAIGELASTQQNMETLMQAGVLEALLQASATEDVATQGMAGTTLARLASWSQDVRDIVLEEGGTKLMLALVDESDDVSVLRLASEGLAFLALNHETRDDFVEPETFAKLQSLAAKDDPAVNYGVAVAMHHALKREKTDFDDDEKAALKRLQLQTEGQVPKEQVDAKYEELREKAKAREAATDAFRVKFVNKEGVKRLLLKLLNASSSLSVHNLIADIMVALAMNQENRGKLVQQGAIKLCLSLGLEETTVEKQTKKPLPWAKGGDKPEVVNHSEVAVKAGLCIAKIAVSTNPALFPADQVGTLIKPLLRAAGDPNELGQFESAMALTNIASLGQEMRSRIVQMGGWRTMEYLCASDNFMVTRAAIGALCNLVLCEEIFRKMLDEDKDWDTRSKFIRIFIVLSGSDDEDTVRYAIGGLANLVAHNDDVAAMAVKCGVIKRMAEALTAASVPCRSLSPLPSGHIRCAVPGLSRVWWSL